MAAPPPIDSLHGALGATPTVRLSRVVGALPLDLRAKLEQFNPTASIKDRIARALVERAETDGRLKASGTVIAATSGNTGIALALLCAVKGYRLIIAMPESMSLEQRQALRSYGGEVVLTPAAEHIAGAIAKAWQLREKTQDAVLLDQFEDPELAVVHEWTTGKELVETIRADGGQVDAVVFALGTGATLTGAGRLLKRAFPAVRIVGLEPAKSRVLSGGSPKPHRIQGVGAGLRPKVFDPSVADELVGVADEDAWAMKGRLAREEGLLVGISSGAAVWACLDVARRLGRPCRVYTVLCDTGERYFSLAEQFAS